MELEPVTVFNQEHCRAPALIFFKNYSLALKRTWTAKKDLLLLLRAWDKK